MLDTFHWHLLVQQWKRNPRLAAILKKQTMSVQFDATSGQCYLQIADGDVELFDGSHVRPDFVLTGEVEAIDAVLRGRMDITQPVSRGQLRVTRGNFLQALGLSRLFTNLTGKGT